MIYYRMSHLSHFWDDIIVMLKEHYPSEDAVLLLGTHLKEDISTIRAKFPSKKLIIFQTEPLSEQHWWNKSYILNKCNEVDEIWETNLKNYNYLISLGYKVKYTPFKYTEALKRIKNVENPDIDVLFYGTLTPHRLMQLKHLSCSLFNLVIIWYISGVQLDEYIARSKIVLNLSTDTQVNNQKESRIFYLLNNNKCVISEPADTNIFGDLIIESINLKGAILEYLAQDKWRDFSNNLAQKYNGKLAEWTIAAPC